MPEDETSDTDFLPLLRLIMDEVAKLRQRKDNVTTVFQSLMLVALGAEAWTAANTWIDSLLATAVCVGITGFAVLLTFRYRETIVNVKANAYGLFAMLEQVKDALQNPLMQSLVGVQMGFQKGSIEHTVDAKNMSALVWANVAISGFRIVVLIYVHYFMTPGTYFPYLVGH